MHSKIINTYIYTLFYKYLKMTTIRIVFEVVRKNNLLLLEYRTGTKIELWYENYIIEKIWTKEK